MPALKVSGLIESIAAASNQQAENIEQVNLTVSNLEKAVQQNMVVTGFRLPGILYPAAGFKSRERAVLKHVKIYHRTPRFRTGIDPGDQSC